MPPAQLWAPGEDGIRASIWEPGGPEEEEGDTCSLAEDPEIDYTGFGEQLLDNFTHSDGASLEGTMAVVNPQGATWEVMSGFEGSDLTILQGAVVQSILSPSPQGMQLDLGSFDYESPVNLRTRIGFFDSSVDSYATVFVVIGGHSFSLYFGCEAGVITVAGVHGSEGSVDLPTVTDLPFCEWVDVELVYSGAGNTLGIYINGELAEEIADGNYTLVDLSSSARIILECGVANAIRVAMMSVTGANPV